MQALSFWPVKIDSWKMNQMDLELGLCPNSVLRRGVIERTLGSANYRSCFSRKMCVSICSKHSLPKFRVFPNPRKDGIGLFSALALVSEERTTVCGTIEEDPQVSENNHTEHFSCLELEETRNRGLSHDAVDSGDVGEDGNESNSSEDNVGKRIRKIDVKALAQSLHNATNADEVDEVLKGIEELPLQVYSTMIRGLGKDSRLDSAIALVEWLKRKSNDTSSSLRPNLFVYNSLLGAVKETKRYDVVDQVIEDMASVGVNPNIVTYNILMSLYIKKDQALEALNLIDVISKKGLSLNAATYSTALFAYRKLEDGVGAIKFFREIREKYIKGEIDSDENWEAEIPKLENFMIRICYQLMRQWLTKTENLSTNVLKLLTEMDKAGLQPSRAEYERLVWACTREDHYAVAKELYERIREMGSGISLSVCNHIIWVMGKAKKWWAALEIYEHLLDFGPKPNNMSQELIVSHFNILLGAARKRGIWRWGVRLIDKMEEKGLKPGTREWNAALIACSKASEASAAIEIFRRMVEQGEKPTIISYGALLSALEKGKLYDEAFQVWKHMGKVGVEPNLHVYTIMASIYAAQGNLDMVESLLGDMTTSGVDPTAVTFNAIISSCGRNNMGDAAYEWFKKMRTLNIAPNEVTYEMLIVAIANEGKPRLAFELYSRAINEGLVLSAKAYDAVFFSSQLHGVAINVADLGPRPLEKYKKVQTSNPLSTQCSVDDDVSSRKRFDENEFPPVEGVS